MPRRNTPDRSDRSTGGFYRHLAEAIAINTDRRPHYAAMTDERSEKLSNRLIWTERLCLHPDEPARQPDGLSVR